MIVALFNTLHSMNKANELSFDVLISRVVDDVLHEAQRVHAHFHQLILLVLVILFECFSCKESQN